jgi:hypothetical protein
MTAVFAPVIAPVAAVRDVPIWHVNSREAPAGNGPANWARLLTKGSGITLLVPLAMVVLMVKPTIWGGPNLVLA